MIKRSAGRCRIPRRARLRRRLSSTSKSNPQSSSERIMRQLIETPTVHHAAGSHCGRVVDRRACTAANSANSANRICCACQNSTPCRPPFRDLNHIEGKDITIEYRFRADIQCNFNAPRFRTPHIRASIRYPGHIVAWPPLVPATTPQNALSNPPMTLEMH
jgi:hypothetical protein